jgi:hypothetical protein
MAETTGEEHKTSKWRRNFLIPSAVRNSSSEICASGCASQYKPMQEIGFQLLLTIFRSTLVTRQVGSLNVESRTNPFHDIETVSKANWEFIFRSKSVLNAQDQDI